jgi:hypothetical protein
LREFTIVFCDCGYALDGFGLYSIYDATGTELTNADLDDCHGRVSTVEWNVKSVSNYHHVLAREYPYTVACFHGTRLRRPEPTSSTQSSNSGHSG